MHIIFIADNFPPETHFFRRYVALSHKRRRLEARGPGAFAGVLAQDEDFARAGFILDGQRSGATIIIGTNLSNSAFPLLRYDTEDLANLSASCCTCGNPGRVVSAIDGRIEDYITLPRGVRLGRLDHIFKKFNSSQGGPDLSTRS